MSSLPQSSPASSPSPLTSGMKQKGKNKKWMRIKSGVLEQIEYLPASGTGRVAAEGAERAS